MPVFYSQEEQLGTLGRLPGALPRWNPKALKGIIGVSGVYNCYGLADHLHRRGLYRTLFDRIMSINGKTQLKLLSPTYCVTVRLPASQILTCLHQEWLVGNSVTIKTATSPL